MDLEKGRRAVVDIEKPAAGGWMIARHEGQVILTAGAIPGERVLIEVTREARGVLYARVRDVLLESSDRRGTAEDHACGGMVYGHIAYARQVQLKGEIVADAFARIARLRVPSPVAVVASPEQGYRMRARLHVSGARVGFYREGTHEICDPEGTGQLRPDTVAAIRVLERTLGEWTGPPVSGIELAENIPATDRAVHLEMQRAVDPSALEAFRQPGVTGLTFAASQDAEPRPAWGKEHVGDEIPVAGSPTSTSVRLERRATAFFQANRYLFPRLLHRVAQLTGDGEVLDLYAGVGAFALAAAAMGRTPVTAVEGDPVSAEDLRRNALPWPSVKVRQSSVERYLAGRPPGRGLTVIVDPPRTGMKHEALSMVLALVPARVVYVSCDVATLARDAARIVNAGYELSSLEGLDLFPNTAHVEAIAAFTRASA